MSPEEFHKLGKDLQEQFGIKQTLTQALTEQYERTLKYEPERMAIFEPRKVTAPAGYPPFRSVAGGLISTFGELELKYRANIPPDPINITSYAVHCQVHKYKVPVYFVAEDFLRAVAATEMPTDITLGDLHWPMPGMVFGLPIKFMHEYLGREIGYIYAASIDGNTTLDSRDLDSPMEILVPRDKVAIQFHGINPLDGLLESFTASYLREDSIATIISGYTYTDFTYEKDAQRVAKDEDVVNKVTALMLKILVVLNMRPALVETGGISRPAKFKHGKLKHCELWSPNIIGGKYRVMRAEGPGTGTHASPRWHWRRGHVTHQRIGSPKSPDFVRVADLPRKEDGDIDWDKTDPEIKAKFWASHKRLWVEPTLINFEEPV